MKASQKSIFASLLLAVGLTLVALPSYADHEKGKAALDRKDYASALREFTESANSGDAASQLDLGLMYYNGQGTPQDYMQAIAWFQTAAEQGSTMAQNDLGSMYYKGQGVAQSYAQAVAWYRKAAEQGNAYAQTGLGLMYYNGQGISQDYMQAIAWFQKAAEQGSADAQRNLGLIYEFGKGVPQDYTQAAAWYRKAAAQGNADAKSHLDIIDTKQKMADTKAAWDTFTKALQAEMAKNIAAMSKLPRGSEDSCKRVGYFQGPIYQDAPGGWIFYHGGGFQKDPDDADLQCQLDGRINTGSLSKAGWIVVDKTRNADEYVTDYFIRKSR
jgi:hypothetical protein